MNDYNVGIVYGTGCIVKENGKEYLVVRNLDSYYAKTIESEVPYGTFESKYNVDRDGKSQWCIKVRNVHMLPSLSEIENKDDFIRAYMELHAILDWMNVKDRKGMKHKKLRLRIYGKEKIISWINDSLPAKNKKIQYIKNVVDTNYVGKTCCIYYQSKKEISDILNWIDGKPRNEKVWCKWKEIINNGEESF